MDFANIEHLKEAGFTGFKRMGELFKDNSAIPREKGVYLVLNLNTDPGEFLPVGTGGFFKGKNPNVPIDILKSKWVENAIVLYIGRTGKVGSKRTLHARLIELLKFGQGINIGHWGGRYIWQLKNSGDLVVCWKALPTEDPSVVKSDLIRQFVFKHSTRPFANLAD